MVLETVEKLKEAGHDLIFFHVPDPDLAASLFYKFLTPDGGSHLRYLYSNEIISPYLKLFARLIKVHAVMHSLILSI